MNAKDSVTAALREHITVCEELLRIEERENAMLASPAGEVNLRADREAMLPRLTRTLAALKELPRQAARKDPALAGLLRAAQELIMKTVALGRENERARLLRGLFPPKHLPSPHRERPHFVAELYRRNT